MGIDEYRKIVKKRLAAIEDARKATVHANRLCSSTDLRKAIENLRIAKLEVEADLRAHERVANSAAQLQRAVDPAEQSGGEPTNAFEWLRQQGRRSPKWKCRRSERSAGN